MDINDVDIGIMVRVNKDVKGSKTDKYCGLDTSSDDFNDSKMRKMMFGIYKVTNYIRSDRRVTLYNPDLARSYHFHSDDLTRINPENTISLPEPELFDIKNLTI